MHPRFLSIKDFTYELPAERIAKFPLEQRDQSKILVYKNGRISDRSFYELPDILPENSLLVLNDTKVICARLFFKKSTGATIEIFLLEPCKQAPAHETMTKKHSTEWNCMIGNAQKWKEGFLSNSLEIEGRNVELSIELLGKEKDSFQVGFHWDSEDDFASILEAFGQLPLPPYLKRQVEKNDAERYQTVYAKHEGSVAAPTAGLHFSESVWDQLKEKNMQTLTTTLHISAGTFQPVKAFSMQDHPMHGEMIVCKIEFLKDLLDQIKKPIVAVGTTSTRTLESLYWLGVQCAGNPDITVDQLQIGQWDVYENNMKNLSKEEAILSLKNWMEKNDRTEFFTNTHILIAPSYSFRMIDVLITNFHQPLSTLLLLVAAWVGEDWKNIYQHALDHNYRFLSYGDSSILFSN